MFVRENKMTARYFTRLFTIFIVVSALAAGTMSASAQTKKKKIIYYSIKTGTVMNVRLEDKLSSKTSRPGTAFRSKTTGPIYSSNGVVLIPAGSTVNGVVASAVPAKKDGKPGSLDVRFTSITLPNKRRAAISGMLVSLDQGGTTSDNEGSATGKKTSRRNFKFIGGGAAGGAIIGGIAGGGDGAAVGGVVGAFGGFIAKKLTKGNEAEVKSGTEFGVFLNRGISLPRYAGTRL
jgi:hypothetical protein